MAVNNVSLNIGTTRFMVSARGRIEWQIHDLKNAHPAFYPGVSIRFDGHPWKRNDLEHRLLWLNARFANLCIRKSQSQNTLLGLDVQINEVLQIVGSRRQEAGRAISLGMKQRQVHYCALLNSLTFDSG